MRVLRLIAAVIAMTMLGGLDAWAAATGAGFSVTVDGPVDHDLYLAGRSIDVRGEIDGDVVAAGGRVSIADGTADSVMIAGGVVDLRGAVRRSARIIGGDVEVAGQVGRDLMAAGGTVTIAREAHIAGGAWLAGSQLAIAGKVDKDVRAAGGDIVISGTIGGDVHLRAGSIRIGPTAVIKGRLAYESGEAAQIDPHATITGGVTQQEWRPPQDFGPVPHILKYAVGILFAWGLFATGLLFVLVFPRYSLDAARLIGAKPLASLGLGFAILVATPVAVLIAMVTVLGAVVGMAVLALYLVSLLLALLTAALFLGDGVLRALGRGPRTGVGRRLGALVLGIVALALLGAVPILGGLVFFLATVFGLGAFYLAAAERY